MKIYVYNPSGPDNIPEIYRIYLTTLEHNPDFETAIWKARGQLGILLKWLHGAKPPTEALAALYQEALSEHPEWHPPKDELEEFDEQNPVQSGGQILSQQGTHDNMAYTIANSILDNYNLPRSWVYGMAQFIGSDRFPVFNLNEPITAHLETKVVGKLAKKFGAKREDYAELALHNREVDGIKITISARINRSTLNKWLKLHWQEIDQLMNKLNLPQYWVPEKMRDYKRYRRAYELHEQRINGKPMPYKQIAQIMSKEWDASIEPGNVANYLKMYRQYFLNKTYSQKIKRTKS